MVNPFAAAESAAGNFPCSLQQNWLSVAAFLRYIQKTVAVGQQNGVTTQRIIHFAVPIGRGEGEHPQITWEYSVMVRSVENFAIEEAAWMLRLVHRGLLA